MRNMLRLVRQSLILITIVAGTPWSTNAQTVAPGKCGEFTIAVIPDTQNYLDYRHQKSGGYPINAVDIFYGQMQYIADHSKSAGGDIVFATSVGDVWQHYSLWIDPGHAQRGFKWMPNSGSSDVAEHVGPETRTIEIPEAIKGYSLIAGKLPFSVVPGNHDYDALWTDPDHPPQPELKGRLKTGIRHLGGLTNFQSAFSDQSEFFKGKPWYVASHDGGADSAQVFTAGSCRFLHIGLQYQAPNDSLAWAERVLHRFSGLPTIVSTHDYLDREGRHDVNSNPDNSILDSRDNNALMLWDKFISRNDQIFLVLSGHIGGQGYSVDTNLYGHPVYQVMADYQGRHQVAKDRGLPIVDLGDGWMRLMTFNLDGREPTIHVQTYSIYYKKFSYEIKDYASWYKGHDMHGLPRLSDEEYLKREDFVISLSDFDKRFDAVERVPVGRTKKK